MEMNDIEDIEKLNKESNKKESNKKESNKKEDVFTELNVLTEQEKTIQLLESQNESLKLLVSKQDSIIKKMKKLLNNKNELFSLFEDGLNDKE